MLVLTVILYIGAMAMSIGYAFYRDRKLEMAARAALVLAGIVHTGIIFMLYRHADIIKSQYSGASTTFTSACPDLVSWNICPLRELLSVAAHTRYTPSRSDGLYVLSSTSP